MMSSCITSAFETYLQNCIAAHQPVVMDEIILAYIPALDPSSTPLRTEGMPSAANIVFRQTVNQEGKLGANAVAYSIVMDTRVGDFTFNAMYLINKATATVGMVSYKKAETKTKTNGNTQGDSIIKTMVMEYSGASLATGITVEAETWQIDYSQQISQIEQRISENNNSIDEIEQSIQSLNQSLTEKADTGHYHEIGDVNGLGEALGGKSGTGHHHEIDNVNGLSEALGGKSDTNHKHSVDHVQGLEGLIMMKPGSAVVDNFNDSIELIACSSARKLFIEFDADFWLPNQDGKTFTIYVYLSGSEMGYSTVEIPTGSSSGIYKPNKVKIIANIANGKSGELSVAPSTLITESHVKLTSPIKFEIMQIGGRI